MSSQKFRDLHAPTSESGGQFAASADRGHRDEDALGALEVAHERELGSFGWTGLTGMTGATSEHPPWMLLSPRGSISRC